MALTPQLGFPNLTIKLSRGKRMQKNKSDVSLSVNEGSAIETPPIHFDGIFRKDGDFSAGVYRSLLCGTHGDALKGNKNRRLIEITVSMITWL